MAKEIREEYLSSLADLNVNSKPLINMLTILAEENIEHAAVIVQAVEEHIAKVKFILTFILLFILILIKNSENKNLFIRRTKCVCGILNS